MNKKVKNVSISPNDKPLWAEYSLSFTIYPSILFNNISGIPGIEDKIIGNNVLTIFLPNKNKNILINKIKAKNNLEYFLLRKKYKGKRTIELI